MFFYATLFTGLVQKAQNPLLMFVFMLALCIVVSFVEMKIEKLIDKGLKYDGR